MKITAFNSSPRAQHSNTHKIVQAFLYGCQQAGAETENIFLAQKKIHYCLGCFDCWSVSPGQCIIKDDMHELTEKLMTSDIVVLATPLYVDNVSGIMKNFLDRLIPIVMPHFEQDEHGETRHKRRFDKYPKFVAISNCGFPEQSHFQTLKLLFRRMARNLHTELIGEIYRGQGELLKSDHPAIKIRLKQYYALVQQAGYQIVKQGSISQELQEKLENPLIPKAFYNRGANKSWDELIAKKQHFPIRSPGHPDDT